MFTALTWIFIVLGAVAGFAVSSGVTDRTIVRLGWSLGGAAAGLLLGVIIWVASWLLALTFQVILWVILFLILTLLGYWFYRSRLAR